MKVSTADKKVLDDFLAHKENDSRILSSDGITLTAKLGKVGIKVAHWANGSLVFADKSKEIKEIVDALRQKAGVI